MANQFEIVKYDDNELEITASDGGYLSFTCPREGGLGVALHGEDDYSGDIGEIDIAFTKDQAPDVLLAIEAWIEGLNAA